MPRSMSTLMQNILLQNSDIYATPTDGSLELLYASRTNFTSSPEFKAQDGTLMLKAWRGYCYWGLQGYANGLTDRPNVCLKSRGIGIHYDWYNAFFGQNGRPVKIICMVRDLRQIFSSMEKLYRSNQEHHQGVQDHAKMSGTTIEKRVDVWSQSQPIGLAIERLEQNFRDGSAKNILFVKAEDLTSKPDIEMEKVYKYLDLPTYAHNFNNVEQLTKEDDEVYGLSNTLHKIRNRVEPLKKDYLEMLGKPVSDWINTRYHWYQSYFKYV